MLGRAKNVQQARPALYDFRVMRSEMLSEDVCEMWVYAKGLAGVLQAGQFVNVEVPGDKSHILRIPLAWAQKDEHLSLISFVFTLVGEGTRRLAAMKEGESSTLIGPLGRGWMLDDIVEPICLVGGGAGVASILAAASELHERGLSFDCVLGAQTSERIVCSDNLHALGVDKLVITTDDGSRGLKAFAVTGLARLHDEEPYRSVLCCGPLAMMSSVARFASEKNVSCQVSLEAMMGCGFGACSCCNVELASGEYALCCSDGPVFDAKELKL